MKCLVFSDSHGSSYAMKSALSAHRDAEAVFFLGDGLSDAELISEFDRARTWFYVRGNCDFKTAVFGETVEKTGEVTLLGKKIVYTHGDLYAVKYGSEGLVSLARERGADIVLFGHTHSACEHYENGVWYLNPGAASGYSPSYGILTLTENGVLFSTAYFM